MKRIMILLTLICNLASCSDKRVSYDLIDTNEDGSYYQLGETNLFNGIVVRKRYDGTRKEETVKNGQVIETREYYSSGKIKYIRIGHGERQFYSEEIDY